MKKKGKTTGFLAVTRDITIRKRGEEALRESEAKYSALVENAKDGVVIVQENVFVFVNKAYADIAGYSIEELIGKSVMELVPQDQKNIIAKRYKKRLRGKPVSSPFVTKVLRKDGTTKNVEYSASLIQYKGRPVLTAVIRDITERKKAEKEVRRARDEMAAINVIATSIGQHLELRKVLETALSKIMDVLNVGEGLIYLFDESRQVFSPFVSQGIPQDVFRDLKGFRLGEGLSGEVAKSGRALIISNLCGDKKKISLSAIDEGVHSYAAIPIESRSKVIAVLALVSNQEGYFKPDHIDLLDRIGEQIGLAVENSRLYEEIKSAEEKYRELVENINDVLFTTDESGVITYISPVIKSIAGYSPSEITGKHFKEFIHKQDLKHFMEQFKKVLSGEIEASEYRILDKSGEIRWIRSSSHPIYGKKHVAGLQGVITEITDRKKAEEALKESEERYRTMVETAPDVIVSIDQKGIVTSCNKAITKITGFTQDSVIGKHFSRLPFLNAKDIPRYLKMFTSLLRRRAVMPVEVQWIHKDGTLHWAEIHVSLVEKDKKILGVQVIGRDFTERKRAEEEKERLHAQLVQSEKMAGVGTLTSGIAHEFNNLLQIMMGHAEFALTSNKPENLQEASEIVMNTSDRVAKIIRDLLAFSKVESSDLKPYSVPDLLESVFSLTEGQLNKRNIDILRDYHKTPLVEVNKEEMKQVFLNMVYNARDAMLPDEGRLKVTVKYLKGNMEISFSDTGRGIEERNLKKVFDPFYTTKGALGSDSKLHGTGLGLTISYGIVKRHGGVIEVKSEVGQGTAFTIKLPIQKSRDHKSIKESHH